MLKFCCNLPNCNQRFATDRGLFQHKIRDPRHNRNKNYDSYNKVGKKRHFQMIQYEGNEKADSNLRKKPSTEPNKIDTDIMSNIIEEDDKISFEDLDDITDENFYELSRKEDDTLLSDGDDDDMMMRGRSSRKKRRKLLRRKMKQ